VSMCDGGGNGVFGTISPSSMATCFPISEPCRTFVTIHGQWSIAFDLNENSRGQTLRFVFFLDLVNALESIDKNDVA
jgi:hypothetical protein